MGEHLIRRQEVKRRRETNLFITADNLPVRVLDRRHVRVAERPAHEAKYERTLADTTRSEHDHTVVVALLRHCVLLPSPIHLSSFTCTTAASAAESKAEHVTCTVVNAAATDAWDA